MKKALIPLISLILILGCLGSEPAETDLISPTTTEIVHNEFPEVGDVVKINYIMKDEGVVVDTTYGEIARKSPDSELISAIHPFGFEPSSFIVGSGHINPEFSTAVITMRLGAKKTIVLPPEKSVGGPRNEDLIQVMERFTSAPREEVISTPQFQSIFGTTPEKGKKIELQYWNSTVTEVDNESTILRHDPKNSSLFEFPSGNLTIEFNETTIVMEFIPKINQTAIANDGRYVTILNSNKTHMTVDYNHHLAGKTLEVEIVLEEISDPILWNTDLESTLNKSTSDGKPVVILFTNVSCVNCRRIKLEALTHPFLLTLKDRFLWVDVDMEIKKDIAKRYGAETLPLM
jgi:FKBP-type peptidyl-prolyl cis-trans isomerase 2